MRFNMFFPMTFALLLLFGACISRPVGKCTYDENEPEAGEVTIVSIEKKYSGKKLYYLVSVKGVFKRSFRFSAEYYRSCIAGNGLKEGDVLKGFVQSGGPCPPIYWLEGCGR